MVINEKNLLSNLAYIRGTLLKQSSDEEIHTQVTNSKDLLWAIVNP